MLLAALCFSVMSVFAKAAMARLPSQEVVLVRVVFTLVLSLATIARLGISPRGNRPGLLALRGLFGTVSLSCFYYGIAHLPLAAATIIQHTSPVLTALFAAVVLRERITTALSLATLASLGGVALMVSPTLLTGAHPIDPLAVAISLAGAVAAASVYLTVRQLRASDDTHVIVLYFALVSVPVSLPFALSVWRWPTAIEWLLLAGVGVSTQLAQVYMTRGLQLEPAGRASSMNYMQIVFSMILGVALFHEWPHLTTVLGAAVVVGATAVLAWHEGRTEAPTDG
jgi:drug/metabolite transporter (DMT)-like permease